MAFASGVRWSVTVDRVGFGGHVGPCRSMGATRVSDCRTKLLKTGSSCGALSYKNGICFLHDVNRADFYTDVSYGNQFHSFEPVKKKGL